MIATHEIAANGAATTNLLRLEARGPLAVLLWPVLKRVARRTLSSENDGLKKRAQQSAGSPGA
ncbi:MAG: hypothetical protein GEU90_03180 [Gemmatimonas sp.]|nr:hypothetical protein [Gemmatimonas sp.]